MPNGTPPVFSIDVSGTRSFAELETLVKDSLGCTEGMGWYGLAWYLLECPTPLTINLVGLEALRTRLPRDAQMLLIALREAQERRSHQGFVVNVV
jgi:hypothetical protein